MIKKLLWSAAIAVALILTGCSDRQGEVCQEITKAIENQQFDKAAQLSDNLYADLDGCHIETLTNLTSTYIVLASAYAMKGDEDGFLTAMQRAVDCYDKAEAKDPAQASKLWQQIEAQTSADGWKVEIPKIITSIRNQLDTYGIPATVDRQDTIEVERQGIVTEGMGMN